uniref:Uncharacterized protein n=1 Tax=Uncultured archaeon GZfos26G2 TaxID=3386331 RepID=Q64EC1_UNCAG|nr:hypothetical protein GZ12E2_23 [uncultured archaeon GZfos12E2]
MPISPNPLAFSAQRLKSFSCSLLCSIQYTSNKLSFSFSFPVFIFYPTILFHYKDSTLWAYLYTSSASLSISITLVIIYFFLPLDLYLTI